MNFPRYLAIVNDMAEFTAIMLKFDGILFSRVCLHNIITNNLANHAQIQINNPQVNIYQDGPCTAEIMQLLPNYSNLYVTLGNLVNMSHALKRPMDRWDLMRILIMSGKFNGRTTYATMTPNILQQIDAYCSPVGWPISRINMPTDSQALVEYLLGIVNAIPNIMQYNHIVNEMLACVGNANELRKCALYCCLGRPFNLMAITDVNMGNIHLSATHLNRFRIIVDRLFNQGYISPLEYAATLTWINNQ